MIDVNIRNAMNRLSEEFGDELMDICIGYQNLSAKLERYETLLYLYWSPTFKGPKGTIVHQSLDGEIIQFETMDHFDLTQPQFAKKDHELVYQKSIDEMITDWKAEARAALQQKAVFVEPDNEQWKEHKARILDLCRKEFASKSADDKYRIWYEQRVIYLLYTMAAEV